MASITLSLLREMAVIKEMLGERAIAGFKGQLDFYYHNGVPCVRRWPRPPSYRRSALELANQTPFKEAATLATQLSKELIQYYKNNAAGTSLTWKDLFFRSYLSGLPTEVYQGANARD